MTPGEQLFFYARPEGGPLAAVVMTLNGVFFPSQIRWCLQTSGPTAGAAAAKEAGPQASTRTIYRRRNEVERTINRLKNFRAVATRFDKRAYVFHGTVTVAAIRLWLRPQ